MDENKKQKKSPKTEGGNDIFAIIRVLWAGRKLIIITTAIFIVLGLVAALTMRRVYTVSTVMVPQLSSARNSQLSGLAALAGFDIGASANVAELSPLVYPQIVNSVPYRLELMHTPLHYMECDTMMSLIDYTFSDLTNPSMMEIFLKYTVGLPGLLMSAIAPAKIEVVMPEGSGSGDSTIVDNSPKPILINNMELAMMENFGKVVSLDVDKKEGYITLNIRGSEPIQTAELALKAQQLLQDEITRFRVEKSQSELEYIEARYNEVKKESDRLQVQLASVMDRSQNIATRASSIERERLQAKYNVSNAVYIEMAKQLEQAKMQVKKDTPVFTIIQPVTVPLKSSNSRAKTLITWTFFGFVLGCGLVFLKGFRSKQKAKFKNANPEPKKTEPKVEKPEAKQ